MTSSEIRALRARFGWRQRQLADYLGITQQAVSLIERGQKPSGPVLKLLVMLRDERSVAA
jgi:transcriptional regulator with XRE-family HTH domain